MNPTEIEFAVKKLVDSPFDASTFPFDLIAIYNAPKITVTKLKNGQTNAADSPGDVLWKKHFYFHAVKAGEDVAIVADELLKRPLTARHNPRFIFVTDGENVHIRDRKLDDTCNATFALLDESSDFLLPLAGWERQQIVAENEVDIKATKRLAKLYDSLLAANPTWSDGNHTHEINLLMTRLLFCLYAEDTGIFDTTRIFSNTVSQYTKEDGSDLADLIERLFRIMNTADGARTAAMPAFEKRFPYVNGSLFEDDLPVPTFSRTSRRLLIECGQLDWTKINTDIFGSMIQSIAEPGARGDMGMHYTSLTNIMKVLKPLFLDDLTDAYHKALDSVPKLESLLARLSKIRVFDPACGSGNFLIVAYKQLRDIEIQALQRLGELAPNNPLRLSSISLENFFGIDTVDFACETAKLSLWIAEYQMNSDFKKQFGAARPPLPLARIGTIHNTNAVTEDWATICPPLEGAETYICGNPPFSGSVGQTTQQKRDITFIFSSLRRSYKDLNYISCWFLKAADYINRTGCTCAFVSTNSVCQGEHVAMLWPHIFSLGIEIGFAYTSFKWRNNAARNAGVTCVIIGLNRAGDRRVKPLFVEEHKYDVAVIGPYLVPGTSTIVERRTTPLSDLPRLSKGSLPNDGGHLILSTAEREALVSAYPNAAQLLKRYCGSDEFIKGKERWCLWIPADQLALANQIPDIKRRIDAVQRTRLQGGSQARGAAGTPYRFAYVSYRDADALLVPEVSSERRQLYQIGLMSREYIINNKAYVLYQPPAYLFSLLSSRLHTLWGTTVGGRLDNRPQYSAGYVYNTFPVPDLSAEQKRILAENSRAILRGRAAFPGKSIAWLYNPETMPEALRQAHSENDAYIEELIYGRKFKDDTQRLEMLFEMYERARLAAEQQLALQTPGKLSA